MTEHTPGETPTGSSYRPSTAQETGRLVVQAGLRARFDRVLVGRLARQLAAEEGGRGLRVVDLGCADGALTRMLTAGVACEQVVGVDADEAVCDPHDPRMPRLCADVCDPATADLVRARLGGAADLVTCSLVIQHVAHPAGLLEVARRLLRPGGRLLIAAPEDALKVAWPDDGTLGRVLELSGASPGVSDRGCARKLPGWLAAAGFTDVETHADVLTSLTAPAARRHEIVEACLAWRTSYLDRAIAAGRVDLTTTRDELAAAVARLTQQVLVGEVCLSSAVGCDGLGTTRRSRSAQTRPGCRAAPAVASVSHTTSGCTPAAALHA